MWNSSGEKNSSGHHWCLRYWAPCDDLVVFKLWAGVIYLSFSIDTATQWILWKRSKEDWSVRGSRDGHSSSSSISPTLLVFFHLLQVQQAAVLWTFSIWLIRSFEWGLQMAAAYSSLGWTKVMYYTGQKQLLFCMKAFSYHPELPGVLVQTTTLRENPTSEGAWSHDPH